MHCNMYNQIHKHSLMLLQIFCGVACSSSAAFVLITQGSKLHLMETMLFVNALVTGAVLLLLGFHYPSKVKELSSQALWLLRNKMLSIQTSPYFIQSQGFKFIFLQKSFKGMTGISIRYFQNNQFEKITPLALFDFSMATAINLVLME